MGLIFGLAYGLVANAGGWEFVYRLVEGFGFGLLLGPVFGLALGLNKGLSGTLTPRDPLRNDFRFGLVVGLTFWLGYGLMFWPMYRLVYDLAARSGFAFVYGIPIEQQYEQYGWAYGFSSGIAVELLAAPVDKIVFGCAFGLIDVLMFGLAFGSAAWTRYAITITLTALRRELPWRLSRLGLPGRLATRLRRRLPIPPPRTTGLAHSQSVVGDREKV